jgi:meso-butanediol dehydrogenase/(S,S)-butanediol dehydrogenase/diacetyl reductase
VADPASLGRAAAAAATRLGPLGGWVNNAGIVQMIPAKDISPEAWGREFQVNVAGVMNGAQAAFRAFAGNGGVIVNIASNAGKVGFPNMAAYNATKAAVINLTRSLAREWAADRVNVNAVCPGSVATPMLRGVADRLSAETGKSSDALFAGMVPAQLGRHIQPIEIGRVVAFLLSEAAEVIRGQAINLDGGDTPY